MILFLDIQKSICDIKSLDVLDIKQSSFSWTFQLTFWISILKRLDICCSSRGRKIANTVHSRYPEFHGINKITLSYQ